MHFTFLLWRTFYSRWIGNLQILDDWLFQSNLEKNDFKSYEKDIAYQKTPLVGQSLPLDWLSILLALSRVLFLHLFLLFRPSSLCSIVFLFLWTRKHALESPIKKKKTKTNKQNKTKSLFSSCPSGYIPTSLLPFWRNTFQNRFLCMMFLVLSLSIKSSSLHWKCSYPCSLFCSCPTWPLQFLLCEGCSPLGEHDTIPSSWLQFD